MKKCNICFVTGSRAEYGLLYWLMKGVKNEPNFVLQIIATGMHLSPEFGLTYREIEQDGFNIDSKVEMLVSGDTPISISKSTGLGIIGFADSFSKIKPNLIILVGDRFEILAAAVAATFARIPIAHIHGGETTEGAFDEAIRHSITKMAWWHFTAAEEYKKRIIQLGENPNNVFLVGGLSVDMIKKTQLLSKESLSRVQGFEFFEKNLLVTYHPVTLEKETSKQQLSYLLKELELLTDTNIIFTLPNADTDSRIIYKMIKNFVSSNKKRSICFKSMGHINYLSTLQFVDAVVGNSSSGLTEAPTFKIGTINIGDRQKGRLKADSIIDCQPNNKSIKRALEKLYSDDFQSKLKFVKNPYGKGDASDKILKILKNESIPTTLKKKFYNL